MLTKIRLIVIAAAVGVVLAGPGVASAATAPEAKRFHGIGEQAKRFHGIGPDAKRFHGFEANGYRGFGYRGYGYRQWGYRGWG